MGNVNSTSLSLRGDATGIITGDARVPTLPALLLTGTNATVPPDQKRRPSMETVAPGAANGDTHCGSGPFITLDRAAPAALRTWTRHSPGGNGFGRSTIAPSPLSSSKSILNGTSTLLGPAPPVLCGISEMQVSVP